MGGDTLYNICAKPQQQFKREGHDGGGTRWQGPEAGSRDEDPQGVQGELHEVESQTFIFVLILIPKIL